MPWRSPQNVRAAELSALEQAIAATEAGVVTAAGDLVVAAGPGVLARLPLGSGGQVLRVASGAVAWGALALAEDEDLALPPWGATEVYR
jgi:hypothetical protein